MTAVTRHLSTMGQLGALLELLWSSRPRFWRRNIVRVVAASDVGTVRTNNEDYFLIADLTRSVTSPAATAHGNTSSGDMMAAQPLLVVADGMGGAAGGEVASATATAVIWSCLAQASRERWLRTSYRLRQSLLEAFRVANNQIRADAARCTDLVGMGTTATVAVVLPNALYVGHVGDSRAYLVRDGRIQRLTRDHSLVQYLTDTGVADEVDAARGRGHALLRALGAEADVVVDISHVRLRHGDVVVLCSDGVWSALADDEIAEAVNVRRDLRATCERLVTLANERGGRDNATAIVSRLEAASWRRHSG